MNPYYVPETTWEKVQFIVLLLAVMVCIGLGAYWMIRLVIEVCAEYC